MTSVLFSAFLLLQTSAPAAGVKISGKVTREQSQVRQTQVRLSSGATGVASLQVPISPDGTFAFPKVLKGSYTAYTRGPGASAFARVTVAGTAVTGVIGSDGAFTFPKVLPGNYIVYLNLRAQTQVTVGNKDVPGVTVAWPRDILVGGHVIVEGVQTVTRAIIVEGKGPAGPSQTRATPAFILSLGKGENAVSVRNIPEAYRLKSITYGTWTCRRNRSSSMDPPTGTLS